MDERFERFQKMAKEKFGLTITRNDKNDKPKTFKDVFGIEVDCDGRCLNCDYYEPMISECRKDSV